jgi:ABC-type multidrug transport system fused ATPase/permease subunit
MLKVVNKIYFLLSKQERRKFLYLTVIIIVVGLIDVAGIASIMPFMAVVTNPEVVRKNHYLFWLYKNLYFSSMDNFLVFLGFVVFSILLLSNALKALVLWLELNFVHFRLYTLSRRLLLSYMSQPYVFFLGQNTAILGKNILQEVAKFTHEVLRPCTQIFSRIVAMLLIFGLLIIVDPLLAVMIVGILGCAYIILYNLSQRKLARLGEERFEANAQRSKLVGEAFGGIKDLKILNRELYFLNLFSRHARIAESKMVTLGLISQLPSYIMEVFSFGGILIIVLYFLVVRQNSDQALPVMALYAFAGYRLMPALQGIFSASSILRFNKSVLDSIQQDIGAISDVPPSLPQEKLPILPFLNNIRLESVTYTYPGAESPVIHDLDLIIKKNIHIGIVGGTGSGKTTTVDILLGLLTPQYGSLLIDGVLVTSDNILMWQRNLGYVPQSIFLCDDSLAGNIAFGIPLEEIDMAAVERAARIASIHDFVTKELPEGYVTNVGERGIRLSGGQRQRIGIARALYHDPEVLIMDEATSALDGVTEEVVIQAIRNLSGEKTIITIAHRLTTLKDSDVIYVMDKGQIVEQGTYAELSSSSVRFRAMAGTGYM